MLLLGEGLQSDDQEDAIDSIASLLDNIISESPDSRRIIKYIIYGEDRDDFEDEYIPHIATIVYYLTLYGFFGRSASGYLTEYGPQYQLQPPPCAPPSTSVECSKD